MKNILKGKWVFDSQVIIYSLDHKSPFNNLAKTIFQLVSEGTLVPVLALQNILEVENVLLKVYKRDILDVTKTLEQIILDTKASVIAPLPGTYMSFHSIVQKSESHLAKLDLYDYFLAATMLDNSISQIITANDRDFANIKGITAYNPWKEITSFK